MALNCRGGERMSRQLLGVKQPPPWLYRAAENDPKRHLVATNYCTAKGLLDHLVGEPLYEIDDGQPNALAVLRLITSSNLKGPERGSSFGFPPCKMGAH